MSRQWETFRRPRRQAEPRPHRQAKPPCPNEAAHTPAPGGYVQWAEWAQQMAETCDQQQCSGCGRWAIWTQREPAA